MHQIVGDLIGRRREYRAKSRRLVSSPGYHAMIFRHFNVAEYHPRYVTSPFAWQGSRICTGPNIASEACFLWKFLSLVTKISPL